jgi:hypothetical protein
MPPRRSIGRFQAPDLFGHPTSRTNSLRHPVSHDEFAIEAGREGRPAHEANQLPAEPSSRRNRPLADPPPEPESPPSSSPHRPTHRPARRSADFKRRRESSPRRFTSGNRHELALDGRGRPTADDSQFVATTSRARSSTEPCVARFRPSRGGIATVPCQRSPSAARRSAHASESDEPAPVRTPNAASKRLQRSKPSQYTDCRAGMQLAGAAPRDSACSPRAHRSGPTPTVRPHIDLDVRRLYRPGGRESGAMRGLPAKRTRLRPASRLPSSIATRRLLR